MDVAHDPFECPDAPSLDPYMDFSATIRFIVTNEHSDANIEQQDWSYSIPVFLFNDDLVPDESCGWQICLARALSKGLLIVGDLIAV